MKKIKTVGAVVAGNPIGTIFEVTDKNAEYLVREGYAVIVEEKKAEESKPKAKAESAPTDAKVSEEKPKQPAKKSAPKTKDK